MNSRQQIRDLQQRWVREASTSDLGLWWIADDVRALMPCACEETVIHETLEVLRPLLEEGALRAVDLLADGIFKPWPGTADEQLKKIESEWRALGSEPNIGDVVWFVGGGHMTGLPPDFRV